MCGIGGTPIEDAGKHRRNTPSVYECYNSTPLCLWGNLRGGVWGIPVDRLTTSESEREGVEDDPVVYGVSIR